MNDGLSGKCQELVDIENLYPFVLLNFDDSHSCKKKHCTTPLCEVMNTMCDDYQPEEE